MIPSLLLLSVVCMQEFMCMHLCACVCVRMQLVFLFLQDKKPTKCRIHKLFILCNSIVESCDHTISSGQLWDECTKNNHQAYMEGVANVALTVYPSFLKSTKAQASANYPILCLCELVIQTHKSCQQTLLTDFGKKPSK